MAFYLCCNSILSPTPHSCILIVNKISYYIKSLSISYIMMSIHLYLSYYHHHTITIFLSHHHIFINRNQVRMMKILNDNPCHIMNCLLFNILYYYYRMTLHSLFYCIHMNYLNISKILFTLNLQHSILLKITFSAFTTYILTSLAFWVTCYTTCYVLTRYYCKEIT